MTSTEIVKEWSKEKFNEVVRKYKDRIIIGDHTTDRLHEAQRKATTEEEIRMLITRKNPEKVGIQANGRIAAFFREKTYFHKIILEEKEEGLEIITFINVSNPHNMVNENARISSTKEW